jgi:hypothetical protein
VTYCSGKVCISISSHEAISLPEVDSKMRGPISEQYQILVLHLCVAYLDGLQYPIACYTAVVIRLVFCS